jgi:predicted ATPase/signal transduction histidine kinase/tRNA A-37 threonylcarbamoyl transferase component Bud32
MQTHTLQLAGYHTFDLIHQGAKSLVYRGQRIDDQKPVILKLLRSEYPSFSELVQFRNQYTITHNLNIPGIVPAIALEQHRNSLVLVMPDYGSLSLADYLQEHTLTLKQCLQIGIKITQILAQLYHNRIIHKDIKKDNILVHPETLDIQLIDFSIATLLPKETQIIQNPNILEGTLAYISPEQTGRMNRGIDYRTDFYSLGVTLYELITGKLPFEATDAMELVHCHIAKMPMAIGGREEGRRKKEEVPEVVSDIVLKLMAKNAEDRYQSAWGIQKDLETCLYQLETTGKIEHFEIAKQDICDQFNIPEKLYGRETEVQQLLEAFDRVANPIDSQSSAEMMLVAGYSGVGKTAVVNVVHKPIVRQRGYFIKGKFDQFNRNIPFSAFVQALRDLMGQLLSENDSQLQEWKDKILAAVGENGQVIIEVIPELENIIGSQPPIVELSGSAAQNRFNLLFQNFIQVFTTHEHPLVIFLDDLQWADSASLQLIKLLMSESNSQYLFLIGAYRDNEVTPAHPLMLTLDEIDKSQGIIHTIILAALQQNDLNQLVADTLHCSLKQALPLTQAVYQKTKGNPFFATQFLKALYEDGLIYFSLEDKFWQCDLAQVKLAAVGEDVVEFVSQRLQKLDSLTQDALKLAACIGNEFDLETLAMIRQTSLLETANDLWLALKEGLILPTTEIYKFYTDNGKEINLNQNENNISASYKFLHDRIQQAAYALIPEDKKKETHLKIGQLLLENIPEAEREERIFEIVNQLNYSIELITEQKERDKLAELNLIACRKARSSTAYQAGSEYADIGLSLLGKKVWKKQYEISLEFHELAAELASLCGDFDTMEKMIETVITKAKSLLDQVKVYRIRIIYNVSQNKPTQAITIAQNFLQEFGVTFPSVPSESDIYSSMTEIEKLIGDRKIEDLVNLPQMSNQEKISICQITNSIISPAYVCGSPLYPLLVFISVKLSIQYGNTSTSVFAYANYGNLICNLKQDVNTGVRFGNLALKVLSRLNAQDVKPEVADIVGAFLLPRTSHIQETIPLFKEGYISASEVGNIEYIGYMAHYLCVNYFWCSQPLKNLEINIRNYIKILVKLNQVTVVNWCIIFLKTTLNLQYQTKNPSFFSGSLLQEKEWLFSVNAAEDVLGLCYFYLCKLMLAYLFEEVESAQNHTIEVRNYIKSASGMILEPIFYFYDSLTSLAVLDLPSIVFDQVDKNQGQLQFWATHAPMNYLHKWQLVEAEKCRVLGNKLEAMELYDKAIAGAKENEYLNEEALANELAAKFYLELGRNKVAQTYMIEAYYCYSHWGAKAKVKDLEQRYPQLLAPILEQQNISLNPFKTIASLGTTNSHTQATISSNTTGISEALDFTSIIKASQVLSSEIELNQLISQLMQVMMENAGATKGVLMLSQDSQLTVEAISTHNCDNETIAITQNALPVEESLDVPLSIINLVKRNLKTLNIDDISAQTKFASDNYLMQQQPQSLLCLPLKNRGQFLGILYLENNLATGVFTPERIDVLKLLCSQAAISLENAQLYQKSQNYAKQLEQYLKELQDAQVQLVQSEKMSALGEMMAGIAHEINNPVGFIGGNITHAEEYLSDLIEHLNLYQENCLDSHPEMAEHAEEIDLDYLLEDLPELISSMKTGVERIRNISTSMRTFSRSDTDKKVEFNLHEGIDSTLLILKHRLKASDKRTEINVIKNYSDLPQIMGFPGQLNQVFMNLIANGIDVFDEAKNIENPQITITTELTEDEKQAIIKIKDNGLGMPEEVQQKVFEHLFTTKPVGKGTGLGLSISRQIIEDKHNGILKCNSKVGEGTEFMIQIPIQ